MKKIKSLFCRNYETDGLVRNEVVPGSGWVIDDEGVATEKFDGTCCMVRDGRLFKRYDRKLTRENFRRKKAGHPGPWAVEDFKAAPPGWEACEPEPDQVTTHWPGWLPVGDEPESKWHREAWASSLYRPADGTYEAVGPKLQTNPHGLNHHYLWKHGVALVTVGTLTFDGIRVCLAGREIEGIVWHHPDGRMAKIKRRDFGLDWPIKTPGGEQ